MESPAPRFLILSGILAIGVLSAALVLFGLSRLVLVLLLHAYPCPVLTPHGNWNCDREPMAVGITLGALALGIVGLSLLEWREKRQEDTKTRTPLACVTPIARVIN